MKKQAFNPYLPSYEYIPDAEPHVFGDRVYIYGSHDKFNGASFCLNDYVSWSAPVDDLTDWRYEGVIYRRAQDPDGKPGIMSAMYAPDVCQGPDGRYYLYYFIGYYGLISVAVCDTPAGKYEYIGHVKYSDGTELGKLKEPLQFDPGVFIDDDGKIYMYTGFGPTNFFAPLMRGHKPSKNGAMGFELEKDMITIKKGPVYIGVEGKISGVGTAYEGHEFFEASSLRKYDGKYYFIYSSFEGHELCYAVSDDPMGGFKFGGTLVSIGDVGLDGREKKDALNYLGNTHGSILRIKDKFYIFYHRQTNKHQFSRQACAEELTFKDGKFIQSEVTSCGLNGGPLRGEGKYEARIACNLYSKKGTYWYNVLRMPKPIHPYFTQTGVDRESDPDQYVANMNNGATAVFKYFDVQGLKSITVNVNGSVDGVIEVRTEKDGAPVAEIAVKSSKGTYKEFTGDYKGGNGKKALYFTYVGKGRFDFKDITLNK